MMKQIRILLLLLVCAALLCSPVSGTRAEAVTLGIYFCGQTAGADGQTVTVKLEGSFRVFQNGEEVGVIRAGKDTLNLPSSERIRIEPMPETIDPCWDLSDAATQVNAEAGGTVTVPVTVFLLTAEAAAQAPASVTGGETDEDQEEEPRTATGRTETQTVDWTAPPVATATPEPQIEERTAGEDTGSLLVSIFHDKNNNGENGPYDEPLSGVTVYVLSAEGETPVASGVSDGSGRVLIQGLEPGTYRLQGWAPAGWGFSQKGPGESLISNCLDTVPDASAVSDPFVVRAGSTVERGIGLSKMIHVSGFCWLDGDGDGIRKDSEQMLPGIRITLEGQKNGLHYETTSGEDGSWYIDRVKPGFYTITAWAPDGMMFTRYSKNGGKNRSIFTTEGVTKASKTLDTNDKADKEDQNIGFMWSAQIKGRCFLDTNYNGMYDEGELPMAGVKVTAIKQIKDEEVAVTYSDENGLYTLPGLRGNTFRIRAVLPDDGSDFSKVVSDPLGNHFKARPGRRENFWDDFILEDGQVREANVGVIYPGSVSGTVYMDDDFSASQTGKEKTVSGFTVTLVDEDGTEAATDKTSVKGVYEFKGLHPGFYSLQVTANPGYAFTKLGEGNAIRNKTGGQGYSDPFMVPLGEAVTGKDIGMILPGTVEGTVFADLNDNGLRDEGENGMKGTLVRLINLEENGEEAFRAEIGEDGSFLFDAVMPGRYTLEYQIPEGAIFAQVKEGGNRIEGPSGTGRGPEFDFRTGDYYQADPCGALTLGALRGMVFEDPDGSGEWTSGKANEAGVQVTLLPSRQDLEEITVISGEDGTFALTQLHPDTYTLRVTTPEGTVLSRTDHQDLPLTAGMQEQEVSLKVSMGREWTDQRLGVVIPASLRGQMWLDENNNGVMDEGEQTPGGETVTVTDLTTGKVYRTLRTDKTGIFETEGMIPGRFRLSYAPDENTIGAPEGDSTFTAQGGQLVMSDITLTQGEARENLMLGIVRYTYMGGTVWIDRGSGEEPLSGAVMTLKNLDGDTLQTAETGESGTYRFERLMPGEYVIEGDMPAGSVVVEPTDRRLKTMRSIAAETEGRHGVSDPIELFMGEDQPDLDMGCVLPGKLGDFCWLDLNGNGLQEAGEAGIPGVIIELMRDGEKVAEVVTDQYGFYRFEEIYPAVYTLRVTAPSEVKPTVPRTDIRIIASVLQETEEETSESLEVTVESDQGNYNADLGYVCRQEGVWPEGVGEGATQDWTGISGSEN